MADVALARQQLIDLGQIGVEAQDLITSKLLCHPTEEQGDSIDSQERRTVKE